jgi:magnesium and cobalt exporter, CNNM family
MGSLPALVCVIGLLILLNSLFACLEIALVSVPRARLKRYENEKLPGAATAIFLQRNIDDFFAAIQIGLTFIATLSSAMAGAFSGELFAPLVAAIGVSPTSTLGRLMALLAVTLTISYLSLVFGELVPKSLARRYPGKISLMLARPFRVYSAAARPVVRLLTASTRIVLRLLRIQPSSKGAILTPEELRMMASELVESRQMPARIYDMLVRVTRLSQIRVEDVMIPRHRIVAVKVESRHDPNLRSEILNTYRKHPYTNFPVIDRQGDNVLGVVNVKDLLLRVETQQVSTLLRQATFTARGQSLDLVLATMQRNDVQLSVVVDEHGIVDGIITLEDILEELIGEIESEIPLPLGYSPLPDSERGFAVDGLITLHELKELHSIVLPQSLYYSTLAGFVLDKMGRIPAAGDYVDYDKWRFQVVEMEGNRIKVLRIDPLKTASID